MKILETSIHDPSEAAQPQKPSDGVGPLYHRVYSIEVESTWKNAQRAMRKLQGDINAYSPQLMCRFEKTCGEERAMKPGDEFQIHITGPWNGPVRVTEASPTTFTLQTLEGHMEAGEIQFRVVEVNSSLVRFEIESIARSRDLIVDFVYDKVPIAKFAQTEMWKSVCEAMATEMSKNSDDGSESHVSEFKVVTERRDEETGQWQTQ